MNYRNAFIAAPGMSLIGADFAGQELRGLAEVSRDERLIDAFNNNQDLHLVTGNALFNLKLDRESLVEGSESYKQAKQKYSRERHIGKNGANFPIIYGSTAKGISKNLGISEKEAQGYIDGFFNLYPGVKRAMDKCTRHIDHFGQISNKAGRIRRLPVKGQSKYQRFRAYRQAFNFLIQGMCADAVKAAAVAVRDALEVFNDLQGTTGKIVLLVHDEIVVEIETDYAPKFAEIMKQAMESAYPIIVALPVDISIGKAYGELK